MKNSLGIRFLFTTILMLVVAMGAGTIVSWLIAEDAMNQVARDQLRQQVDESITFIDRWLDNQRYEITSLSHQRVYQVAMEESFKGRVARKAVEKRFSWIALSSNFFSSLSLLDLSGKVVASDLPEEQRLKLDIDQPSLRRAMHNETCWTPVFRSSIDGERVLGLYSPVTKEGQLVGVLYFQYGLERFVEFYLSRLTFGQSGYGFLLDRTGRIIDHPDPYQIGELFIRDSEPGNQSNGFFTYTEKNRQRIGYSGKISELESELVISVGIHELQTPSRRLGWMNLIITVIACLVALIALYLLWRTEVAMPVAALLDGIDRFREGKLEEPVVVEVENELQTLAKNFNNMAEHIENTTVSMAELSLERENLQTILDSMNLGIMILSKSRKVRMMNRSFSSLIGCTSWKGDGEFDLNRIISEENRHLFAELDRTVQEMEFTSRNGSTSWLLRVVQQIVLSGEQVELVTFVDITDQKKAAEQQQLLERDLHQASRLKAIGTLSSGITREIEGPVQTLAENVEFLETASVDLTSLAEKAEELVSELKEWDDLPEKLDAICKEKQDIDLEFLRDEVPRSLYHSISQLDQIQRILSAIRSFGEEDRENPVPYDINEAIESTVAVSHNEWRSVARVNTELDMVLPAPVCFGGEINQVFLSLIFNAVEAIREKGEFDPAEECISIRTYSEADWVCTEITDTGAGMDDEILGRIFDPFFTTKQTGKGTGQGLFLAKRIIEERHRGRLEVESSVGHGTRFTVRLPLKVCV